MESEEETELIFLDLSELSGRVSLAGAKVTVKGLDSEAPVLEISDGTVMDGQHQESVGTQLFVEASPPVPATGKILEHKPEVLGMSTRVVKFTNRVTKRESGTKKDSMARYLMSKMVTAPSVKKRKVSPEQK